MKEPNQIIKQPNKKERIKAILRNGIRTGIFVSLIMNRKIIWAILNGDSSKFNTLIWTTSLLIIGGSLGESLFGRKLEELFKKHNLI